MPSTPIRVIRNRRGGAMIQTLIAIVLLGLGAFVSSTIQIRLIRQNLIKKANSNMLAAEDDVWGALRVAFYSEYSSVSLVPQQAFSAAAATTVLEQATTLLGVSVTAPGTPFTLPAYPELKVTLNLGAFAQFTPSNPSASFGTISGTHTWADGLIARVYPLPVTMTVAAAPMGLGTSALVKTVTRSLYLCEIPPSSMALIANSGLALGSAIQVAGPARVDGGGVTGTMAATGSLILADTNNVSGVTQNGQAINREANGFSFRGQTEIAEQENSTSLRAETQQRVDAPTQVLSPAILYREGLGTVTYSGLTSAQQTLCLSAQPYYGVPASNRLVASSAGDGNLTLRSAIPTDPYGREGNITSMGSVTNWCQISQKSFGTNTFTLLLIDLTPLIVTGQDVSVFIGVNDTGNQNSFTKTVVSFLNTAQEFSNGTGQPSSVRIITPNPVVFTSAINTVNPVPTTIISPPPYFGFLAMSQVTFNGSVEGSSAAGQISTGSSFAYGASASTTATMASGTASAAVSGGEITPIVLIERN